MPTLNKARNNGRTEKRPLQLLTDQMLTSSCAFEGPLHKRSQQPSEVGREMKRAFASGFKTDAHTCLSEMKIKTTFCQKSVNSLSINQEWDTGL